MRAAMDKEDRSLNVRSAWLGILQPEFLEIHVCAGIVVVGG